MADFSRIIESEIFTFLVGPEKKPLRIHSALVKGLSEPLNVMINGSAGGKMQDAIQMQASLEDFEPQTFVYFCEFAYSGMYRAPAKVSNVQTANTSPAPANPFASFQPISTNDSFARPLSVYPWNSSAYRQPQYPRSLFGAPAHQSTTTPVEQPEAISSFTFGSTREWSPSETYCLGCGRLKESQSAFGSIRAMCQGSSLCRTAGSTSRCVTCKRVTGVVDAKFCLICDPAQRQETSLGDFKREYPALGMSHAELRAYLHDLRPADSVSDCLSCHAKLFVFANTFMITPLKDLCLHKLHRDLLNFKPNQDNIKEVVEMMSYTFDNTNEGDSVSVGQELRELVMAYAALRAKSLIQYQEFKEMLTQGGEVAAAFACAMANRLAA